MRTLKEIVVRPAGRKLPLFPQDASSIFVELGFGNGEFTEHLAREHSESLVFGIEVSRSCVLKAALRASRHSIANMYLLCGDARFLMRECFPDDSISMVYMNFPCPWPKMRHEKRRLTGTGFSQDLASVLKLDGTYELTTDVKSFAEEMAEYLARSASLVVDVRRRAEARSFTTKYERKWLALGRPIFLLSARKVAGASTRRISLEEDYRMHARFRGQLPCLAEWKKFNGQGGTLQDGFWVYRDAYRSEDGMILLETIATDQGFEQKYRLRIFSEEGRGIVKIDPYSFPFITPSVRMSVENIAARLDCIAEGESGMRRVSEDGENR
jgi:tRNA (guanine-N7-)-methyltransferase